MRHSNRVSYENRTSLSKEWYKRACRVFPGGINHNIRFFRPYPFFVEKAKGKYLHDVDGNAYVDYWMGHWALILGHSPQKIQEPLVRQLRDGTIFGTANALSVLLAEIIQRSVPPAELIRFCSTGSEATMYATRLARAYTKKRKIVKIIGGWHGFNSDLMKSVNSPFEANEGKGLIDKESKLVISVPFNDLSQSLAKIREIKDDLSCIIVEPILGIGAVPGDKDFLRGLREYAKRNNVLFISDEIVTGFRLSFGTMSELYDLDPDLITLGKIAGGGLPIGVVCGRQEIMRLSDPVVNKQKKDRCYIGGGTFSCNPLSMKAGLQTMTFLKENDKKIYSKINELGEVSRKRLNRLFKDFRINAEVTGIGSLLQVHFLNSKVKKISNATDVANSDQQKLINYNLHLISEYGIFFLPRKMGAISFAHDLEDINSLVSATGDILNRKILKV
jgi:glutamate-1-semialdehyde 2,1-aminomutase